MAAQRQGGLNHVCFYFEGVRKPQWVPRLISPVSPITRRHHLLSGRGLGAHGRPDGDVIGAEGRAHLLRQRVHGADGVRPAAGPRDLPRLHREQLRRRRAGFLTGGFTKNTR